MSGFKAWTEKEVALLDTGATNKEIADKIGRTEAAVNFKRYNRGGRVATKRAARKNATIAAKPPTDRVTIQCELGSFNIDPTKHRGVVINGPSITFIPR